MLSPLVPADRALRALPAAPTRSPAAPPARQAVLASAVAAPPPARESARAGDAALLRTAERSTQPPSPLSLDTPPEAPSARGLAPPRLMGGLWPWVVALLLLPLAAWGWAWFSHRRAFDAAGLPRGPRLKP
jgi:hypothetical protein